MIRKIIKTITPYGLVRLYQLYRKNIASNSDIINNTIINNMNNNDLIWDKTPIGISIEICNMCNLKCTTCDIWKDKKQQIFPMEFFIEILDSSMMKNLRYLDITGGEPTMVNLPAYVRELIDRVTTLERVVINLNCFNSKKTLRYICEINEMCEAAGKILQLNISLNGIGKVHDESRGVSGSFDRVMEVIHAVQSMNTCNIEIIIASRIIKNNIFEMDEFLFFLQRNNIKNTCIYPAVESHYFKSFNSGVTENAFNYDENYQKELLLYKIQKMFPNNDVFLEYSRQKINTGISIADCQYINGDRLHLRHDGTFTFCCHSNTSIEAGKDFVRSYEDNYGVLRNIKEFVCPNCFYYPCIVPNNNYNAFIEKKEYWNHLFTINSYFSNKEIVYNEISRTLLRTTEKRHTIFITGWYGTETTGDKAILGGIIDEYKERQGDVKILISSLYPFVTKRTIYELGIEADVVPVYSADFFNAAASADETIVGGGPLMELEELSVIAWAFYFANKYGKKTKVYGCGVGPLFTDEKKDAIKEIFALADTICLRDEYSKIQAENMSPKGKQCTNTGDPAVKYIQKIGNKINIEKDNTKLSLFLRDLRYHEYFKHISYDEFLLLKERYELGLAENIRYLYSKEGLRPHFYAMNNFIIGADDRDFNFYFVEKYLDNMDIVIDKKLSTVERIAEQVMTSRYNVCMRYHSVVFAHTLHTKFAPIDYTNGGKISAFLNENAPHVHPITLEQIANAPDCLFNAFAR